MDGQTIEEQSRVTADTILIVDDSEINRVILAEIFKDTYQIAEAENGKECLEVLLSRKDHICAVLLDVMMPVMDGVELLRILKSGTDILDTIPVFLITAEAGEQVVKEGYGLGVMDVIAKPVVPYVVKRRVDSVIELFLSRRKLSRVAEVQKQELINKELEIMDLNKGMIEALSTAIEFRSGESGEHVQRISGITEYLLANTFLGEGLTREDIRLISMAAIMHDVGKIAISDTILNKPGRLTQEEFEIMKTHTLQGAELLERIPQLRRHEVFHYAYDIARHHHERWNGKGYPDGLKGDEIPVWVQIVSIADVYDALVSKRVYKDAFSFDEARKMIEEGQCGVFNPRLLEAFFGAEKELRKLYNR
ncbi:MAG TPA: response regulator [Candidatus Blautia faecipullorum]|nr:response regulator [Candidatus Blautia faecipullorum]